MHYDADIIIIGAGPAGLAAAFRSRWVKSSDMVPASVLMLDPAGPGGIAAMGIVYLVGPAWNFQGDLPSKHLFGDLDRLEIPVLREAAIGLVRTQDLWIVHTAGHQYRSLAVVLATGLRRLTDEPAIRAAKRLTFLSGGYARASERFTQWSREHRGARLLIVGSAPLEELLPELRAFDNGRNAIDIVIEPDQRIIGYQLEQQGITLTIDTAGMRDQLCCDHVMLDYHSLEVQPPSLDFLPDTWRTVSGYSPVGPAGDTALPGLFAAGDCAGSPSMCVKALAQGAEAGFAAYTYTYARKFGDAPPMFAFYPSPIRPPLSVQEFPVIDPARHYAVGLTAQSRFPALLAARDGQLDAADMPLLQQELHKRIATVHLR